MPLTRAAEFPLTGPTFADDEFAALRDLCLGACKDAVIEIVRLHPTAD